MGDGAKKSEATARLEAVASVVQRLAVLLAAGVPPASAWGYLAETDAGPELRAIVDSIATGESIANSIVDATSGVNQAGEAWRGVAAAWYVATEAGAPLAPTLHDLASSLRDLAQTGRDVQVALAAPVATARMVMALPVVGVLFGLALGFDTIGILLTTPAGWVCLVIGSGLMLAAQAWNRRLVRSAEPARLTPGLTLDLYAIAVSGGASISRASATVDQARIRFALAADADDDVVDEVLDLSLRAGVPAALLLRSGADEARRTARSDGARKAATLAVKLMLPLGLCILPAFMVLGVAPLVIAVFSSTIGTF